jgi:hypothetical protein
MTRNPQTASSTSGVPVDGSSSDLVRVAVVMPVGPQCQVEFVEDSLESVRHFVPDARIIVLDDSGRATGATAARNFGATVIDTPLRGKKGALYLTLSDGFLAALEEPFDVLLRMDTDALVAGSRFVEAAARLFSAHPSIGLAGMYRVQYDSSQYDWSPARFATTRTFKPRRWIRNPYRAAISGSLALRSRWHGYPLGANVFGGICLYSRNGLEGLRDKRLLARDTLSRLSMMEDHLYSLLVTAAGFDLADLADGEESLMGTRWLDLPASPEQLLADGRELIHSLRRWEEMNEREIRAVFAAARRSGAGA